MVTQPEQFSNLAANYEPQYSGAVTVSGVASPWGAASIARYEGTQGQWARKWRFGTGKLRGKIILLTSSRSSSGT